MTDSVAYEVQQDVAVLKTEIHFLREEVKELKETNKQLLEFMQSVKAGKAVLFSMIGIAATVGGLVGTSFNAVSKLFH